MIELNSRFDQRIYTDEKESLLKKNILLLTAGLVTLSLLASCGNNGEESEAQNDISVDTISSPDQSIKQVVDASKSDEIYTLKSILQKNQSLADEGDTSAMVFLYTAYRYGKGCDINYQVALDYLKRAAVKGNPEALMRLARTYEKGVKSYQVLSYGKDVVEVNLSLAKELYAKAIEESKRLADEDDFSSLMFLGRAYDKGLNELMKQDPLKAHEFYNRAFEVAKDGSKQGDQDASYNLAMLYEFGNSAVARDHDAALSLHEKLAEQGYYKSILRLAKWYQPGLYFSTAIKVEKNEGKSVSLFKKLADLGDLYSLNKVAFFYYNSEDNIDFDMAKLLYRKVLSQDPSDDSAAEYMARIEEKTGNYQSALDLYFMAATMNPHGNSYRQDIQFSELERILTDRLLGFDDADRKAFVKWFDSQEDNIKMKYRSDMLAAMREVTSQIGKFERGNEGKIRTLVRMIDIYTNNTFGIKVDEATISSYNELYQQVKHLRD